MASSIIANIKECLFGIFVHLTAQNHLESLVVLLSGTSRTGEGDKLLGHLRAERIAVRGERDATKLVLIRKFVGTTG